MLSMSDGYPELGRERLKAKSVGYLQLRKDVKVCSVMA